MNIWAQFRVTINRDTGSKQKSLLCEQITSFGEMTKGSISGSHSMV